MKSSKARKIEEARQWLINNDIEFAEYSNGHFRIFVNGERLLDFWATTEKFVLASGGQYRVGMYLIKNNILNAYNKKLEEPMPQEFTRIFADTAEVELADLKFGAEAFELD